MKLLIEVTLKKESGKTCDPYEVFAILEEEIDSMSLYPQAEDADEESNYEVTAVILKESK